MDLLIQKAIALLGNITLWFNTNISHSFLSFIKSILLLISNILEFFISVISWVINHI